MCHQSVGLIARELEARGIPTLSMSSAYSITASVRPPRAVYLDYPLGHTSGKPDDKPLQQSIVRDALTAFTQIEEPGTIMTLPYEWNSDDSWKDRVMRPSPKPVKAASETNASTHSDNRVQRFATPQYQTPEDEANADPHCASCVFLTDPKTTER